MSERQSRTVPITGRTGSFVHRMTSRQLDRGCSRVKISATTRPSNTRSALDVVASPPNLGAGEFRQ